MKKIFYLIALVLLIAGCSTDEPKMNVEESTPETTVEVYGPAAANKVARRIISDKGVDSYISIEPATELLSVEVSEKEMFMQYFPSGVNKISTYTQVAPNLENFSLDFLYVSDGNPFDIYPVYSNGWYDLALGIFYYDEDGKRQDIDFWNMQEDNWGKQTYAYLSENNVTDVTKFEVFKTSANGYTIALPKNTLFGFYINCDDNANAGKFYTAKMENGIYGIHAASFANNGRSYIGFEDQHGGDNDLNDLICFVNPKQQLIVKPTKDSIETYIKKIDLVGEIEVDIHQQEHKDWDEIKTSVHMRHCFDSIIVELPIPGDYTIERDDFAIRVYDNYYTLENEDYYVKTIVRHEADKTIITIKDVDPKLINKLLDKYFDGVTAEIHSYTENADKEYIFECIKQANVTVYPENDNCEVKVNKTSAYGF